MQRDLVPGTFTAEEFAEGLALAQLAPGPLAAQLAIYLGWLRKSATAVAIAFIAPSFVMVLVLSALYVEFGGLPWMRSAFYGIGAAVIGIIARGAWKLSRKTVASHLWAIWLLNAVVVAVTRHELIVVIFASGLLALRTTRTTHELGTLLLFFAKASLVVFGSGLAIVPFLYGGVVEQHHWLTPAQFLDAVAVSMITPGPVVITVAFIGYLTAGPWGAVAAAVGVFLPVYLVVVLAAPYYRRLKGHSFLSGVTAAAAGALSGAVVVLATRAITDVPTALIAVAALIPLPEPLVILSAGVIGVLLAQFSR